VRRDKMVKRERKQRKITKKGASANDDPINALGYGIVAYLRILYNVFCLFAIFSVMFVPTIRFYSEGKDNDVKIFKGYEGYMISNLGQSSVQCEYIPVSVGKITLQCPFGNVGHIIDYGVNFVDTGSPLDACMNNPLIEMCKPDNAGAKNKF